MTRLQFEAAVSSKPKIQFCGPDAEEEDEVSSSGNVSKLQEKLALKEEMLNEAVLEYHKKTEEMDKVQQENEQLTKQLLETNQELSNVQVLRGLIIITFLYITYFRSQAQLERSNLLLADANERLDVREDELMDLEEKLMKANGNYGNVNTELRETKRKIRELESRMKEQNNASMMSTMCEDLQKQLLEADTKLERRKDTIETLKQELSRYKDRAKSKDGFQEELETLRDRYSKSQIQLGIAQKELAVLQV